MHVAKWGFPLFSSDCYPRVSRKGNIPCPIVVFPPPPPHDYQEVLCVRLWALTTEKKGAITSVGLIQLKVGDIDGLQ